MSHGGTLGDSLEGMAGAAPGGIHRMTMAMEYGGFAGQLRRWRALRRMSQLDVAIRADTTQQPAAIRLAARHLGGGTPTDQPGRSQREITINQRRWLLSRPRCRTAA